MKSFNPRNLPGRGEPLAFFFFLCSLGRREGLEFFLPKTEVEQKPLNGKGNRF